MNIKLQKIAGLVVLVVFATISHPIFSDQSVTFIGDFSSMDVSGWAEKSFSGETIYEIQAQQGLTYLHAMADKSASALYKKVKVDLNKTPYLNWSWKIDQPLDGLNEETKAGDDYAARIYVIVKRGLAPWKTNAVNYVWSSNAMPSHSSPNAFTDKAIMVPLRTNLDNDLEWRFEKIDVKVDFKKYFGVEIGAIDGVAIMTDADNSQTQAAASYGDIFFSEN
jgi:hypothetical protein